MSEKTHFENVVDYVMADDYSDLGFVKAERDFALHCLEREIAIAQQAQARIEALEAVLRSIANKCPATCDMTLAREMAQEAEEALAALDKDAWK